MRAAAMSKFGWGHDGSPSAPWQISGRRDGNRPIRDPGHPHAFWLPEDANDDGRIDHLVVYIAGGMNDHVRSGLDSVTRIWLGLRPRHRRYRRVPDGDRLQAEETPEVDEWRLALEGFGNPQDFSECSRLLGRSRLWQSVTPFLASGHLKKTGHRGEALRLMRRRGMNSEGVEIDELPEIGGTDMPRRVGDFFFPVGAGRVGTNRDLIHPGPCCRSASPKNSKGRWR